MPTQFTVKVNNAQAALNGKIDSSQTTLKLKSRTTGPFAWPTTYPYKAWIDQEAIEFTADDAGSGDDIVYTVTRGVEGTTPASHIDESQVELRINAGDITALDIAVNALESGAPAAFTQGSIPFGGPSGVLVENNADVFWDDTSKNLVIGDLLSASGGNITNLGLENTVTGDRSTTLGRRNDIVGDESFSIGVDSDINGTGSYAFGASNNVDVGTSYAFGASNTIDGTSSASYAFGTSNTVTDALRSTAIGQSNSLADGVIDSVVIGNTNSISVAGTGETGGYILGQDNSIFNPTGPTDYAYIVGRGNQNTATDTYTFGRDNINQNQDGVIVGHDNDVVSGTNLIFGNRNTGGAGLGVIVGRANDVQAAYVFGRDILGSATSKLNLEKAFAFGNTIDLDGDDVYIIGKGITPSAGYLTSTTRGIHFGMRSTVPTMTVSDAGNFPGAIGFVGIGTESPFVRMQAQHDDVSFYPQVGAYNFGTTGHGGIDVFGPEGAFAWFSSNNYFYEFSMYDPDGTFTFWNNSSIELITLMPDDATVGILTTTPDTTVALDIAGKLKIEELQVTTTPTAGYVLTADASGNATWQASAASGLSTLNGLSVATQNFVDDTNVTIVSAGSDHTITWAGTLAVARGGTGSGTASGARTNLGLEIGVDVQAWDTQLDSWSLKNPPSGNVVGDTDVQTLTNKTITSTTNDVAAKSIHSATTVVDVSTATAPTVGQVLTATSGTAATWQNPTGGLSDSNFVDNETPSGTIDGVNDTFTLANTPTAGTEHLYKNGIRQKEGASNDYTISGATITFNAGNIPQTGDSLLADYRKP